MERRKARRLREKAHTVRLACVDRRSISPPFFGYRSETSKARYSQPGIAGLPAEASEAGGGALAAHDNPTLPVLHCRAFAR